MQHGPKQSFDMFDALGIAAGERDAYTIRFNDSKDLLQKKLEHSAFRRGISTGIQGSMKLAPSDHSPITANINGISMMSWNLLSDEHTINFLLDITRKEHFAQNSKHQDGQKINWQAVFEDFGNFALAQSAENEIKITNELLENFVNSKKAKVEEIKKELSLVDSSSLSIEAEAKLKEKILKVESLLKDTEEFVSFILNLSHVYHEDFKNSLVHIIEIVHSIKHGYLQWKNRFNIIKQNKTLLKNLVSHDILCFQECTTPQDMLDLLKKHAADNKINKDFSMIFYKVKETSKDCCVIIYDQNKYKLAAHSNFGLSLNPNTGLYRKPCIMAKFRTLENPNSVIVGSIHHPGTGNSELETIIKEAQALQEDSNTPIIVLGDYNHQRAFFNSDLEKANYSMIMPSIGTMAGHEYGNLNAPIDGALTNCPKVRVAVLEQKTFASQVTLPISIEMCINQNVRCLLTS